MYGVLVCIYLSMCLPLLFICVLFNFPHFACFFNNEWYKWKTPCKYSGKKENKCERKK